MKTELTQDELIKIMSDLYPSSVLAEQYLAESKEFLAKQESNLKIVLAQKRKWLQRLSFAVIKTHRVNVENELQNSLKKLNNALENINEILDSINWGIAELRKYENDATMKLVAVNTMKRETLLQQRRIVEDHIALIDCYLSKTLTQTDQHICLNEMMVGGAASYEEIEQMIHKQREQRVKLQSMAFSCMLWALCFTFFSCVAKFSVFRLETSVEFASFVVALVHMGMIISMLLLFTSATLYINQLLFEDTKHLFFSKKTMVLACLSIPIYNNITDSFEGCNKEASARCVIESSLPYFAGMEFFGFSLIMLTGAAYFVLSREILHFNDAFRHIRAMYAQLAQSKPSITNE